MQMRSETVSGSSFRVMNILMPRVGNPTLGMLQIKFPEQAISSMEDRSFVGPIQLGAERLITSPLPEVDSERYDLNLAGKELAGYQHAAWLLENKPKALLDLLLSHPLEFPGTRVLSRGGKGFQNPRFKNVKVGVPHWLIPVMPCLDNGSHLRIIWTPMGAGDREHKTRFARAFPM